MTKPLRVLVVQDSEADASVWLRELSQGGFELTPERVESEVAFRSAVERASWDLVLAEYQLAEFNALAALQSIQDKGLDLPFIIVSEGRGEEVAVAAMKAGAHDYVLKSSLSRLASAVEHALREAAARRDHRRAEESLRLSDITEHKQVEEALRKSEMKTRAILDHAADGIMTADERGLIESFNPAAAQTFGYEPSKVIGQNIRLLIPRPYLREHESYSALNAPSSGSKILSLGREVTGRRKDGQTFPLELAVSEVWLGEKRLFIAVVRDITERKQAQDALANSREQLRSLAAYVESVREEERTRMAREVHDVLGQSLTGLKMDLAWLSARLPASPASLVERARSMSDLTDETIQTVRKIASDLRPGVLDNLGLVAAIEWQGEDFQSRTGIECACQSPLKDAGLEPELCTTVFRIFQETLTNVARHARATAVLVSLNEEAGELVLNVQDNGRGIDESQKLNPKSLGLLGMRERAFLMGGEVRITGVSGQGTQVTLTIPLAEKTRVKGQP